VNGKGGGSRGILIGDHIEVEEFLAVVLYESLVDDRARAWVDNITALTIRHLEEPSGDSLVHKHVQDLRVIVRLEGPDGLEELATRAWALKIEHLVLEGWATDAIAPYDNLARDPPITLRHEVLEGLQNKLTENASGPLSLVPLDLFASSLTNQLLVERLVLDHAEVLRSIGSAGGCEADDGSPTLVADVDANEHRVQIVHLILVERDLVQIHWHLGIYLAHQVGEHAQLDSTFKIPPHVCLGHELGDDA
jgi:hypothetical protein